jgi:hypothetical protein
MNCPECGTAPEADGIELVCGSCGWRVRNYAAEGTDVRGRSAAPRSAADGGPVIANVVLCQVTPNKKTRLSDISDEIRRLLDQNQNQLPPRVTTGAAELFYRVQQYQTLRGDVRKGTIAACFFWTCRQLGMVQKNEFLAKLFGVHRNNLSGGNKIIEEQINHGLIEAPPEVPIRELMRNYLQQYFAGFRLKESEGGALFFEFCHRVSYFCHRKKIGISSIPSSKCAGSLYLLAARMQTPPDLSSLKEVCECTPSTAKRFSEGVEAFLRRDPSAEDPSGERNLRLVQRKLRHIFSACGLPPAPLPRPARPRRKAAAAAAK